jgi:hypothetical protein
MELQFLYCIAGGITPQQRFLSVKHLVLDIKRNIDGVVGDPGAEWSR